MKSFILISIITSALGFSSPYSINFHLGFNHFQQQVKSEIGGVRGERLINQSEFNSELELFYSLNPFFQLGWNLQYDIGEREAGKFSHLDGDKKAVVDGQIGGDYWELWTGPVVKTQWKFVFAEFGYGLVGLRQDDARNDIPDSKQKTSSVLKTNASVAWIASVGIEAPLIEKLSLSVKLKYRVRYYSSRGDVSLINNYELGSQNITPMMGVKYQF